MQSFPLLSLSGSLLACPSLATWRSSRSSSVWSTQPCSAPPLPWFSVQPPPSPAPWCEGCYTSSCSSSSSSRVDIHIPCVCVCVCVCAHVVRVASYQLWSKWDSGYPYHMLRRFWLSTCEFLARLQEVALHWFRGPLSARALWLCQIAWLLSDSETLCFFLFACGCSVCTMCSYPCSTIRLNVQPMHVLCCWLTDWEYRLRECQ